MINIKKDYELILNTIEGLLVIDENEKIIFMHDKLAQRRGYKSGRETVGENIKSIMTSEENRLYKVLETEMPQIGEIYFLEGDIIVSNGFPIYKNGRLVGAFEYEAFNSAAFLHGFLDKLYEMSAELSFYRKEYDKIQRSRYSIDDIVGESNTIKKLKEKIYNIAKSNSTVLIQGETGSGKELIAHAIHKSGQRGLKNFIKINCATIPENLFEAELYGYEENSFTGAKKGGKKGKAELANGGILFLDEIDQLTLTEQPKLLRFLQEKEICRVGGYYNIPINVRVITATNKNLLQMVQEGKFREDLYYRLSIMEINTTPLRERKTDIPILAEHLLKKINEDLAKSINCVKKIDDAVIEFFCKYNWPGNVRELRNVLERAINECSEQTLKLEHLQEFVMGKAFYEMEVKMKGIASLEEIGNYAEKMAIQYVFEICKGNKSKATKLLNISRQSLYQKINKFDIKNEQQ